MQSISTNMRMPKILRTRTRKHTRDTAKAVGIELTGKWEPCEGLSTAKVHRDTVPKRARARVAVERGQHASSTVQPRTDYFSRQEPHLPVGSTRSRSTRAFGGGTTLAAILRARCINTSPAMQKIASLDDHVAIQAAVAMPEEVAKALRPDPTTPKQADASYS